ncbi:hypothetical protein H310_08538 [Aphanomyces invadans]|uniref:Uncharacterized protein n=1 Tax=Aphanomyces invadans TaxID=157072 RepID=A0A024TYQ6_9STRA|nr:hypothetical protein H310_08538 [Aphanomyces invadans]ETV99129.1 hypothetical protein H310_08538 [Aphanomyces invadans]|eukprot:XP_008872557.1 hypothetical protein H310_08538 [Aphanomyces invadans]
MSDMQCKYAYKECYNLRTLRRDGGIHRLCEFHRSKANALQKAYATKRRRELRAQKRLVLNTKLGPFEPVRFVTPAPASVNSTPRATIDLCDIVYADFVCPVHECAVARIDDQSDVETLSDDEVAFLNGVL